MPSGHLRPRLGPLLRRRHFVGGSSGIRTFLRRPLLLLLLQRLARFARARLFRRRVQPQLCLIQKLLAQIELFYASWVPLQPPSPVLLPEVFPFIRVM